MPLLVEAKIRECAARIGAVAEDHMVQGRRGDRMGSIKRSTASPRSGVYRFRRLAQNGLGEIRMVMRWPVC
jgi:hypothetical protein